MKEKWTDYKTREDKQAWLENFYKEYPPQKKVRLKEKSDSEISDLFWQYRSHCDLHKIKILPPTTLQRPCPHCNGRGVI
jgi:hypothetical protein